MYVWYVPIVKPVFVDWQDWPGDIGIHSDTAVQEDDDTDDGCWD